MVALCCHMSRQHMNTIVYCRVSSRDQIEGTSLESQERACRDYAAKHGLVVTKVFVEEGESAKFADRTQLLALLDFCRQRDNRVETLLVWKVDRFARNVEDHFTVKANLRRLGVTVLSVTEPIEADPNGKLLETILAGFAQFDNDVRAVRTVQGMQQRLRDGIYPWKPPLGYISGKLPKKTEPDRPDPKTFALLQRAWRFFATGSYTKATILRLLRSWGVTGYHGRPLTAQTLDRMFRNVFYAGRVRDPWSGEDVPGKHVPMVTTAEYWRVQEIIASRNRSLPHNRLHPDFSLRGFVKCPSCNHPMTGAYSTGKYRPYPYYSCAHAKCPTRRRGYRAEAVELEFTSRLASFSMPRHLATEIVAGVREETLRLARERRTSLARRDAAMESLNEQMRELVTMRASCLISDDEFLRQRDHLRARMSRAQGQDSAGEESLRPLTMVEAEEFVEVVCDLPRTWSLMPVAIKQRLRAAILPDGYQFRSVRTPNSSLLFSVFQGSTTIDTHLVPQTKSYYEQLLTELRSFLAIIRSINDVGKEAA